MKGKFKPLLLLKKEQSMPLELGKEVPDFSLFNTHRKKYLCRIIAGKT
jgi:hypothetical protein